MSNASQRRLRSVRRSLAALVAAACALATATPAGAATRPVKYVPVYVPLAVINCPKFPSFKPRPKDLGYLPALGNAALRWIEPAPAPRAVEPPPVVLYNPPDESAKTPTTDPTPTTPDVSTEPAAEQNHTPTTPTPKPTRRESPLRAEDFLPFFEAPGELPGARGDADGSSFVPARPVVPESRAEYRQK